MKLIHTIALTVIITMILILSQVKVKAAGPLMVKAGTDHLEVSHDKTEAKYSQRQFQNYRFQRGAFQQNCTQYGNNRKPYFKGNQTNNYRGRSHG